MNKRILAGVLALVGCPSLLATASAGPTETLRDIEGNAVSVTDNARDYQWKRVTTEVGRIIDGERQVQAGLGKDPARRQGLDTLHRSVADLRSSSTAHDVARTEHAAHRVLIACLALTESTKPRQGGKP